MHWSQCWPVFLNLEVTSLRTIFSFSRAPAGRTREHLKYGGIVAAVAVVSAFLFLFDAAHSVFYPPCPFRLLTGFYCPGCGSLRALHQVLHGNLLLALNVNPLTVLLLPFLGYGFISYSFLVMKGRPLMGRILPAFWIWLLLGVIVTFGVARNIPVHPFLLLAP